MPCPCMGLRSSVALKPWKKKEKKEKKRKGLSHVRQPFVGMNCRA